MTFDEAFKAIKRANIVPLRHALASGLNPDFCNKFQWTILMIAAMTGNTRIGRLLIEKGADVNRRNKFGQTALGFAIMTGHPSFVRILLSAGANLDLDGKPSEIDVNWAEKYTAISKEQAENIRIALRAERKVRESNQRPTI